MIIGLGTDIVELSRLKPKADQIAQRILTKFEYAQYCSYHDARRLEFLAGRFAAKEAIIKAYPKVITMQEIEITMDEKNKPTFVNDYRLFLSISHEKKYATATAIIEE